MSLNNQTTRFNFLRDSASHLNSLSPSTAAYLLMVQSQILHEEFRPLNQRQLDFACGACGTIRDPASTKTIQIKRKKSKRVDSSVVKGASTGGATVYKCLRCRRRTVKPATAVRSSTVSKSVASAASTAIQSTISTTVKTVPGPSTESLDATRTSKSVDNASSKKRAKTRKGGLQALLASKQQSQSKSSQSLDLFDFLQE